MGLLHVLAPSLGAGLPGQLRQGVEASGLRVFYPGVDQVFRGIGRWIKRVRKRCLHGTTIEPTTDASRRIIHIVCDDLGSRDKMENFCAGLILRRNRSPACNGPLRPQRSP
jgi:hypothetical protein